MDRFGYFRDEPPDTEICRQFDSAFQALSLEETYPVINRGIENGQLHWILQSFHVLLGHRANYQPLVEPSVFDGDYEISIGGSKDRSKSDIADCRWLTMEDSSPICITEIERVSNKPQTKAKNLVRYSEQIETLGLCVLHLYESALGESPDGIKEILAEGYTDDGVNFVPRCPSVIIESRFSGSESALQYQGTHLVNWIVPRNWKSKSVG